MGLHELNKTLVALDEKVIIRIKIFDSAHFSFSGISTFARYAFVIQNDREYRAAVNHYL